MNVRLTAHLFRRVLRGRRLIGATALASVAGLLAWISSIGEAEAGAETAFKEITSSVPAATLSIAVLFLATAVLRDERDGGTLPFLFVTPISRLVFAGSAWAAAAIAALAVSAAGWLVVLLAAGLGVGTWSLAWPVLATYAAAAVAYSALFVPLGYLFSRSLLVGLGYVFVWEGILASVVSGLSASSVWRIALAIYADLAELPRDALDVLGSVLPGTGGSVVTILVLVALGVSVLVWAMRYRDAV
jgi:ABC-type transport system involved in multi-copper enzyme maturation permease subunit